jgi:hypothetical protein
MVERGPVAIRAAFAGRLGFRNWGNSGRGDEFAEMTIMTQLGSRVCIATIKAVMVYKVSLPPTSFNRWRAGTQSEHSIGGHDAQFRFYLPEQCSNGADGTLTAWR